MIGIIAIAAALVFIIGYPIVGRDGYYEGVDHFFWSFIGVVIGGAVFGLGCLGAGIGFTNTNPGVDHTTTVHLSALGNQQSVEGRSYFLGSGYINGSQHHQGVANPGDDRVH